MPPGLTEEMLAPAEELRVRPGVGRRLGAEIVHDQVDGRLPANAAVTESPACRVLARSMRHGRLLSSALLLRQKRPASGTVYASGLSPVHPARTPPTLPDAGRSNSLRSLAHHPRHSPYGQY